MPNGQTRTLIETWVDFSQRIRDLRRLRLMVLENSQPGEWQDSNLREIDKLLGEAMAQERTLLAQIADLKPAPGDAG